MRRHKNKQPFAYEHSLIAYYAINRAGLSIEHQSLWNQVIGNWNLAITNRLDIPNSVFFFGVGNETMMRDDIKRKYYRLFSTEFFSSVGINRQSKDNVHFFEVSPFYQNININLRDDGFIKDYLPALKPKDVERKHFIGATTSYAYTKRNDNLAPTKGFVFSAAAAYVKNVKSTDQTDEDFTRYTSAASVYLPLSRVITLAVRAGGAAIQGDPEFYQLARLGGNENLRGFRRQRFYGKRAFYNNNDLRVLWPTQNRVFDGKVGFVAFIDQGRVWQPGEDSNKWHVGYGGGPVIQFFNQLLLNVSYGFSDEDRVLHLRLGFLF
jgi:outer membrane protein assembly factor BamA